MLCIYLIKHYDLNGVLFDLGSSIFLYISNALLGFILSYLFCQIIQYSSFLSLLGTSMTVIYIY